VLEKDVVDEVEIIGVVAPSVERAFGVAAVVVDVVEDIVVTDELICSDV